MSISNSVLEINLKDSLYPPLLKQISDPPDKIFARGNIELLKNQAIVGIVGTRKCTSYGIAQTDKLSSELARAGAIIVSGLARGIDGVAHKAALAANGKTVAVLGTGVDKPSIYPPEHRQLAEDIVNQEGLLISEYPIGTGPERYHFPARNRIIAGSSHAVVVTEAPEKSGALITAYQALDYNREVFAVPGNITSSASAGPNKLISKGARVILDASDILEMFPHLSSLTNRDGEENKTFTPEQNQIIELLKKSPLNLTEIAENVSFDINLVLQNLTTLELADVIYSHPDGNYSLKI